MSGLLGGVIALAVVACITFMGVAINEWVYASDHPYEYGPAKVIATGAVAGAVLSAAVGLLALAVARGSRAR